MERGDEDASEGSEQQEWPEHATGERRRGRSEEAISTHMAQKRAELQWERSNRSWRTGKDETNDGTRRTRERLLEGTREDGRGG
jgi:hypothetical protein